MTKARLNDIATAVALVIGILSLIFSIVTGSSLLAGLRQVADVNVIVKDGLTSVVDHLVLLDADQVANCLVGEGGVAHLARWCQFAHEKGLVTTISGSARRYTPTANGSDLIQVLDPTIVPTLIARVAGRPSDSVPQHLLALDLGALNRKLFAYKIAHSTSAGLQDAVAILAAILEFPAPSPPS